MKPLAVALVGVVFVGTVACSGGSGPPGASSDGAMRDAATGRDSHADAPMHRDARTDADSSREAGSSRGHTPTADAEVDAVARTADATPEASGDALPAGTVSVSGIEAYMFQVANGGADHCTTVGQHEYCGGSCNGTCAGTAALSTYSILPGVAHPAFGTASTRVDVSGPGADTLEWVKVDPGAEGKGAHQSATHFVWDLYFYPTSTQVQAYEFDAFFGANGWWLMMGSQCDLVSGNWNGWDQATGHWVPSSVDGCGSFFHVNTWNHIVLRLHRDPGLVGSATQYYYDGLEVNGVTHTWGLEGFTGTENGWGDVVGVQVQQDLEASFSGTLSSYYGAFTLDISP